MNLLDDEQPKKKTESSAKKMVKILLILSVVALIIVFGLMMFADDFSSNNSTGEYKIYVNGIDMGLQTITQNEIKYIPIKEFVKNVDFDYYNGKYKGEPTEEIKNCYMINSHQEVVELSTESKIAYKSNENLIAEKQSIELSYDVIVLNDKIYVSLEDALNILSLYAERISTKTLDLNVMTTETYVKNKIDTLSQDVGYTIDSDYENTKAVRSNLMVISESGNYGVIDLDGNEIIGKKYKSILYDEYTKYFIVSDSDGMYGVIDSKGNRIISLKYDKMYIVSYSPVLYAVMKNNKYGIINEDEDIVVSIMYDRLACAGDTKNELNSTFIIPNVNNTDSGIVVCKDNKYGIIDLVTSKTILECQVDKIYSRTNKDGTEKYVVIVNNEEIELQEYIKTANTVVVIQN